MNASLLVLAALTSRGEGCALRASGAGQGGGSSTGERTRLLPPLSGCTHGTRPACPWPCPSLPAAQPEGAGESCISCGSTRASTSLPGRLWSFSPLRPDRAVAEPRCDELGEECVAGRGPAGSGGNVPELLPAKVCAALRLPGRCCSNPPLLLSAVKTGAFCTLSVPSYGSAASFRLGCSGRAGAPRIAGTVPPGTRVGKRHCFSLFFFA